MTRTERYDLIAILAGDKDNRHPPARTLLALGWADHITVTGEHERLERVPDSYGRVLRSSPTTSTHEDARAIRALAEEHGFRRVLVVTAASQVPRAGLTVSRELRGTAIVADILSWETTDQSRGRARIVLTQLCELVKLIYYVVRGRV